MLLMSKPKPSSADNIAHRYTNTIFHRKLNHCPVYKQKTSHKSFKQYNGTKYTTVRICWYLISNFKLYSYTSSNLTSYNRIILQKDKVYISYEPQAVSTIDCLIGTL